MDRLQRRESRFDQQLHLALISETCDHATHAGGIESRQQQAARLGECMFEFHLFLEGGCPWRRVGVIALPDCIRIGGPHFVIEHCAAGIRGQSIEHARLDGGTAGNKHFEYRQRRRDRNVVLNQIEDGIVQPSLCTSSFEMKS